MKSKARCPGSCGELIQGMIGNSEKLLSYPINLFSTVTIEEVKAPLRSIGKAKTVSSVVETLKFYGEKAEIADQLEITVESPIPVAKGMAGSTADVAAAAMATANLLGKKPTEDQLAQICVRVEPTDSIIYRNLTLFDHLQGKRIESFDWNPGLDILILESDERLDTIEFRKNNYDPQRLMNKDHTEIALSLFKHAYGKRSPAILGEAAMVSALANQSILYKKSLEEIIEIVLRRGCYGVNVAHSGTVIGIIFENPRVEIDRLISDLREKGIFVNYPKWSFNKIVQGGTEIMNEKMEG